MKDAVGRLMPLLLSREDSPFAITREHLKLAKAFQDKGGTEIDRLLFRRTFELQHWLDLAKSKLERCSIPADAKTLRQCIKRVCDKKRLLLGVLVARRKIRCGCGGQARKTVRAN